MNTLGYLSVDDLYVLSEKEVIERFKNCDNYLSNAFRNFEKAKVCFKSDMKIDGKYSVNVKSKRRFINPLVWEENVYGRVYDLSKKAKKCIDDYMSLPIDGYTYLDFDFVPVVNTRTKKLIKK